MIRYTAYDQAYNRASCKFRIRVQGEVSSIGLQTPHSAHSGLGLCPSTPRLSGISPGLLVHSETLPCPEASAAWLPVLHL